MFCERGRIIMGSVIHCFKDYKVFNKSDYSGEYDFQMIDERNGDYIYPSILWEIDDFLKTIGTPNAIQNIITILGEVFLEDLSKKEVEHITLQLIQPELALRYISENKIVESINKFKPNNYESMLFVLEHIIQYLKDGYYIICYN